MSLTLAGCFEAHQAASPNELKPVVRIPITCERLLADVAVTAPQVGDDAKVKMFEYWGAVVSLRGHSGASKECQRRQRNRFAKG